MVVTEIPDSEDEPLTSSPQVASDVTGEEVATREPLYDAVQGAGCHHQAPTKSASYAATCSDESLSTDRQNMILATTPSNTDTSADLQPNKLAQQPDGIESGQSDEQFHAQMSPTPHIAEARAHFDQAVLTELHFASPMEQNPGENLVNTQEVKCANGDDRMRSEDGEERAVTAEGTLELPGESSKAALVLDPSHEPVSPVEHVNVENTLDMQPAQPHATYDVPSNQEPEHAPVCLPQS